MTRQPKTAEEPEEVTTSPASPDDSGPVSSPAVESLPPAESPAEPAPTTSESAREMRESLRALSAVQQSAKLQTQNLELVVSRVQQMADSQAQLYKAHQEALSVLKTSADLMQEFMAALNEQTERLVTVSAALLRYSQEQAAMIASGGGQG